MTQFHLINFAPDPQRLAVLAECITDYGIDEADAK